MPPDCENCRACIANPDKVRYNGATKNKGGFEMETENNNVQVEPVPYIAHEAEMARIEREHDKEREQWNKEREQHKRTVRWLCSIIVLLVLGLIGMFIYEAQYIDEGVTQEVDTGDGAAYVAGIGDIYYGEGSADGSTPY